MTAPNTQTYRPAPHDDDQDEDGMSGPYAFISDERQSLSWFRDSLPSGTRSKFDLLNPDFGPSRIVMPGHLILVGDETTSMCTPQERLLMSYAREAREALFAYDLDSAHVLLQNYDWLQDIMTYGSIGIGSTTSGWSAHLNRVESTLRDINTAHQQWRSTVLTKDQFLARRRQLFSVLDGQLKGFGRWGTGLRNNSSIKKMLGISSKRFIHTGEIANYAQRLKRINNIARMLSNGTLMGVALDVGAGALEISEACSVGRQEQCTKAKFVEVGKMMVGIPAAGFAGRVTGPSVAKLCLRMAGPSRGASLIACGIAAGATVSLGAGTGGSAFGESAATMLYEIFGDE
jgi:hypothetical protein